jgi:pimeloyl-ACP methyl ester carboxylesterase
MDHALWHRQSRYARPIGDVRYAEAGAVRLAYRVTGAATAPAMVVLHALGLGGSSWDETAGAFADSYRIYAPDLRGHGDSDRPAAYSFELMRDDVLAFLDALGLDRVVLVGHSMGGSVAFLLVEEHPERVDRLVIEDTPPPFVGAEPVRLRPRRSEPLPYDARVIEAIVGQLNDPDPK